MLEHEFCFLKFNFALVACERCLTASNLLLAFADSDDMSYFNRGEFDLLLKHSRQTEFARLLSVKITVFLFLLETLVIP